ncbi:hypothetical protein [Andreprevotia chitinilytica]|uniref:hypothetical protein n=1 Tax=Andreprevotia chitinilytica TaxID=396808 RepID=UPI0005573828|nr:hypothetical protein [Andreprevotia chitinilytica]
MGTHTIDTAMAKCMVEAAAIGGASIIGQPGGWSVMLKIGTQETPLGAQRTDKPRLWRSLDRCVEYLRNELHIARFELLDATNYSAVALIGKSREDASERLRQAHEAAAHDKWFRAQVEQGIREADDPNAEWISNEDANASWAAKRAKLAKRTEGGAV